MKTKTIIIACTCFVGIASAVWAQQKPGEDPLDRTKEPITVEETSPSVPSDKTESSPTVPTDSTISTKNDPQNNNQPRRRHYPRGARKPIIYLYPTEETEVLVSLGNVDRLTHTYPPYELGWRVIAKPDGNLTEVRTNRELYALYWEGRSASTQYITEGFVVAGKDTISFLEEKLPLLGLNAREMEEFIIYWLPQLESNPYNLIRFLPMEEQEKEMPLTVTPKPDTVIRVMMAFKPLIRPVKVAEQKLPETPERNGFVVVEWGGTKIGTDLLR